MKSIKKRLLLFINLLLIISLTAFYFACSNNHSNSQNTNSSESKTNKNNNNPSDNNSKLFPKTSGPFYVYGSKYSFMKMIVSDEKYQTELQQRAGYVPEININILFYDLSKPYYKLLFDRAANIISVDYPSSDKEKNQKYILYKVIINDSNGDKKLDNDDNNVLFISDLYGNNLTQVTDSKLNLVSYSKIVNDRLLIIESTPNKEITKENWPSKVIIYDMNSKKMIENKFDIMLEKAIKIFNKKGV